MSLIPLPPQPKSLLFISQENGFSVFTTFNFGFWLGIGIVGLLDAFNWVQVTIFKLVCKDCVTWAPDFWFSLSIPLFPYKILEDSTNCQYLPLFPIWKFNVGIGIAFCLVFAYMKEFSERLGIWLYSFCLCSVVQVF